MEELVIQILEQLIKSSKDYAEYMQKSFDQLKDVDKDILAKLEKESPRVKELLKEFQAIYERIQKEI